GKKYAVYCEENAIEDLTSIFGTFAIKFVVYKGYSESLRDTNDLELLQENVQFEQGLELAEKLKYKHKTKSFKIYNGSTDVIDPLMRHKLIIKMSVEAPNGFKIRNKTTKDVFEYKKKLKKSQAFVLNDVYPYVDKKRVGVDTNYSYITLTPGENNIVIEGDGVEQIDIEFIFNFIYRWVRELHQIIVQDRKGTRGEILIDFDPSSFKYEYEINNERSISFTAYKTNVNADVFNMLQNEAIVSWKGQKYVIKQTQIKSDNTMLTVEVTAKHIFMEFQNHY